MIALDKFTTWALTAGIALAFSMSFLLDGPSDLQVAEAQAADLADARQQAQHEAEILRRCQALRGPSAVLLQIRDTDNYVCREGVIEPTPASVMQRYALMGGQQ